MFARTIILSLILVSGSIFLVRASKTEPTPVRRPLAEFPTEIADWKAQILPDFEEKTLAVLGVEDYLNRLYYDPDGGMVTFYIGYYQNQRHGDTIHSPLNCLPGAGWNPVKKGRVFIPLDEAGGQAGNDTRKDVPSIEINRMVIQKGLEKQLVLYWYHSHGRVIASEYWGKIYSVLDAIRMNRTDAALIRVMSPVAGSDVQTEQTFERKAIEFVRAIFPLLGLFLPV